jgi:SAM-dependent methyltransferase
MQPREYEVMATVEQRHWWYRALRRRLLEGLEREARRRGRPLQVFDAGCGTGGLLQELRRRPDIARAEGCDLHPLALEHARSRGLTVSRCSVNDLEAVSGGWDVVFSVDVLYHRQVIPERAMAGMARLLAPGGLLLLNVAAMPGLARRHDQRVMGARRFLPDGLRRLATGAGLRPEELTYWNSWLTPPLWLWLRLQRLGASGVEMATDPPTADPDVAGDAPSELALPPLWLNRSLERLLELERRLARRLPLPWGSSLLLAARKPTAQEVS